MTGAVKIETTPDGGFLVMGSPKTNPDGPDPEEHPVVSSFASAAMGISEMLIKFTPAGKVDTTFGKNGVLRPENPVTFSVDSAGRILVGGFRPHVDRSDLSDALLTRYTAKGALDTSFGTAGQVTFLNPGASTESNRYQDINSIAFDSAGRIFASMLIYDTTGGDPEGFAYQLTQLIRLSDTGQIDPTYTGQQINKLREIAGILPDGSALLIGKTIAKVNPSGQLDTNYGTDGVANTPKLNLTPPNNQYVRQASHRFAVSPEGYLTFANLAPAGQLQLTRLAPTGQPDSTFGSSGTLTLATDGQPDAMGYLGALEMAPDGSILIAGQTGALTPDSAQFISEPTTITSDTRTATVGRILTGAGPAAQLIPVTMKSPKAYLYITVLLRDPDGVDLSSLDNADLKLFDSSGNTRKFRFVSSVDVNADGQYISARYRIIGPGSSNWTAADNGIYQVRLQRKQIFDSDANPATAQILGTVRVRIT